MSEAPLFAMLEPPPGGRERLRARLREARPSAPTVRAAVWRPALAVVVAAVALGTVFVVGNGGPAGVHPPESDPALVALGLVPVPGVAVSGRGRTAVELALATDRVDVYIVGTLEDSRAAGDPRTP